MKFANPLPRSPGDWGIQLSWVYISLVGSKTYFLCITSGAIAVLGTIVQTHFIGRMHCSVSGILLYIKKDIHCPWLRHGQSLHAIISGSFSRTTSRISWNVGWITITTRSTGCHLGWWTHRPHFRVYLWDLHVYRTILRMKLVYRIFQDEKTVGATWKNITTKCRSSS